MTGSAQELRLHDARSDKLGFLAAALGAFAISAAICNGATPTQDTTEPLWPTKEWQMSTPEAEGMDSKELAKLVDWGTTHSFDSLLVVRHGKIVAEAYSSLLGGSLGSVRHFSCGTMRSGFLYKLLAMGYISVRSAFG